MDYPTEESLIAELQRLLREKGKRIMVSADYKDFEDDYYQEDFTDYKEDYLERICDQREIHNVQMKVNFGNRGEDRFLDLAVLREDYTEVKIIDGKKYFPPGSIEHAIQVHLVERENVPPKNPVEDGFNEDFEKLRDLGEPKSRHLVIFSNKNIFQYSETDERFTEVSAERYRKLEEKFKGTNIIVEECYPGKRIREEW